MTQGGCAGTRYGCCPDGTTSKASADDTCAAGSSSPANETGAAAADNLSNRAMRPGWDVPVDGFPGEDPRIRMPEEGGISVPDMPEEGGISVPDMPEEEIPILGSSDREGNPQFLDE